MDYDELIAADTENHDYENPAETPDTAIDAGRHMRLLAHFARRQNEANKVFDAEIARIETLRQEVIDPLRRQADWHAAAVERWHRYQHRANGLGKTYQFPHGTSELRALPNGGAMVEIDDPEALHSWASERGIAETIWPVKERLLKSPLKTVVKGLVGELEPREPGAPVPAATAEGEPIPGVSVTWRPDAWKANPATQEGQS